MRLALALFFLLITASYSDTLVTFTLAWEAPATGAVTGYNIYMGERSSVVSDDDRDLSLYAGHIALGNQLSVQVFLTHPTTYFTITAVNGNGQGPPSNELVVTMSGSRATVEPPGDR
jgi:fibronectin type III domain protein